MHMPTPTPTPTVPHSPAPWHREPCGIVAANGVAVATVWDHEDRDADFHPPQSEEESDANERLVIAAPGMYKVLVALQGALRASGSPGSLAPAMLSLIDTVLAEFAKPPRKTIAEEVDEIEAEIAEKEAGDK